MFLIYIYYYIYNIYFFSKLNFVGTHSIFKAKPAWSIKPRTCHLINIVQCAHFSANNQKNIRFNSCFANDSLLWKKFPIASMWTLDCYGCHSLAKESSDWLSFWQFLWNNYLMQSLFKCKSAMNISWCV